MAKRFLWGAGVLAAVVSAGCRDAAPTSIPESPVAALRATKAALAGRGSVLGSGTPFLDRAGALASLGGGTSFYDVYVKDSPVDLGVFTVATGANHPVTIATGTRQSVLYGGGESDPFSSYLTVRSYTTGTDYTQGGYGASTLPVVALRPGERGIAASVAATAGGFVTTYDLPGGGAAGTPDRLRITQLVRAVGSTFDAAAVEVTTTITNTGTTSVRLGLRYLWDIDVGKDDGPSVTARLPDAGPFTFERAWTAPTFAFFQAQDNRTSGAPTYRVFGTVTGPSGITPTPSGATRLVLADWASSFNAAFDYSPNPASEPGCVGGCDDAVAYYVGDTPSNAVTLTPGTYFTYSQSLAAGTVAATPLPFSNRPPIASAGGPYTGTEGTAITFDASASSDPDRDALSFSWDFNGDGVADATGARTSYVYPDNGSFVARVTVTDARGASSIAGVPVTVSNAAPLVSRLLLNLPDLNTARVGRTWTFGFQISDKGTLDGPWGCTIDWGDGSAPERGSIASLAATTTAAHRYAAPGARTVKITVTDKDGGSGIRSIPVTVVP